MSDARRSARGAGALTVLAVALVWAFAATAQAGTITVSTTFDELDGAPDATCSLREAVQTANGDVDAGGCTDATPAAADTVVLGGGEYDLTLPGSGNTNLTGDLDVSEDLTIQGAGPGSTGIDGNGAATTDRVLHVTNSGMTLSLTGLAVYRGRAAGGGGINAAGSTVNLTNAAVTGNLATTTQGGGVAAQSVNLTDSTVSANVANGSFGGGIEASSTLTMTDSTVRGNRASSFGGGLHAGLATITNSTVSENVAGTNGGGIAATTANLTGSTVSGNDASGEGGGIDASLANLTSSTVSDNHANTSGGGISGGGTITDSTVGRNEAGTDGGGISTVSFGLTVARSTIAGNDAVNNGGGVAFTSSGGFSLTNSTVSGNRAEGNGGGIHTDESTTDLRNATINRNIAESAPGNGIRVDGTATVNLRNTILAGNAGASPDCQGTLNSEGYNLFGNTASCTIGGVTTGNITNPAPGLELLANNGGPTLTHALSVGSPALNAGYPGAGPGQPCETVDQRNLPRGGGAAGCDIGAFEAQTPPTAPPATTAIRVTTTFDDLDGVAPCSLREAVRFANDDTTSGGCADSDNAVGDADTIVLAGGAYDLTRTGAADDTNLNGDLDVLDDLTIQGAGADATGIDANGSLTSDRALHLVNSATTLSLSALTVHDGNVVSGNGGGILAASGATADLTGAAVSDNSANGDGGGISAPTATLSNSAVSGNSAGDVGGGIEGGSSTLSNSTVSGNISTSSAGGINAGNLATLTNSTITGNAGGGNGGGVNADNAVVTGSTISGNITTGAGGGINASPGDLTNSVVTDNAAGTNGGGFRGNGSITDSTVRRNEADQDGAGTFTEFTASLTVLRSTIAGNDALDDGGGVFFTSSGTIGLTNSTLSGNSAAGDGGGLATDEGTTNLRNATVNGNVADVDLVGGGDGGGMLDTGSATLFVRNTIVAGNSDLSAEAPDCSGTPASEGYNLFGNTSGCTVGGVSTGNVTNPNPGLELLASNGGPTLTHALLSGSPALNAGYPGSGAGQPCEATDQRNLPRGGAAGQCDIGAFEFQPPAQPPVVNPPVATPAPAPAPSATKKCKKGQKLRKGKCVKKKRRKRK